MKFNINEDIQVTTRLVGKHRYIVTGVFNRKSGERCFPTMSVVEVLTDHLNEKVGFPRVTKF